MVAPHQLINGMTGYVHLLSRLCEAIGGNGFGVENKQVSELHFAKDATDVHAFIDNQLESSVPSNRFSISSRWI